jgi:hypothetical protein
MERRRGHFIELCDSGRWRHYYTQTQFLEELRKVMRVRERWAAIAGLPPDEDTLSAQSSVFGGLDSAARAGRRFV